MVTVHGLREVAYLAPADIIRDPHHPANRKDTRQGWTLILFPLPCRFVTEPADPPGGFIGPGLSFRCQLLDVLGTLVPACGTPGMVLGMVEQLVIPARYVLQRRVVCCRICRWRDRASNGYRQFVKVFLKSEGEKPHCLVRLLQIHVHSHTQVLTLRQTPGVVCLLNCRL